MGYTRPNGVIELFKDVPLSPDHSDVMYITSNADAYNHIRNYKQKVLTEETYTRTERGTLKVGLNADDLLQINYICWKNGRANMYFFAFVTNIGYINENCTEISYMIDNYMTWFGFLQLGQCFVEREIPETDGLFENLVPENIELGDPLMTDSFSGWYPAGRTAYLIMSSTNEEGERPDRDEEPLPYFHEYVNGIPSGLYYWSELIEGQGGEHQVVVNKLAKFIQNGYADNIIQITAVPDELVTGAYTEGWTEDRYYEHPIQNVWDFTSVIDGYKPQNKKLFSYPYNYIKGVTSEGNDTDFKLEYWENGQVTFSKMGTLYGNPTMAIVPTNYRGQEKNFEHALYLSNFPTLPWINDPYKAYLAQNKASIATSIVSSVLSGISGGLIGGNQAVGNQAMNNNIPNSNPVGQISTEMGRNAGILSIGTSFINAGLNIASVIAKQEDTKALPASIHGNTQADCFHVITGSLYIGLYHIRPRPEFVKIIDEYFSMFGYACHRVKTPNISSRTYWNYVKTIGCVLKGSAPAQAKAEIINMFNNGVRLWKHIADIGNYSLKNGIS